MEAYNAGQHIFGENKVQDLADKYEKMPKDIEWHMIGHLQTNKVKYIAPFVSLIHSVDSLKLLKEINKQGIKNDKVISCLLQVHIAQETTKFGLSETELFQLFIENEFQQLANIRVIGLMGMATYTEDEIQIDKEFNFLHTIFTNVKTSIKQPNVTMTELSIGMSGDYQIAIKNGSTMIRIGTDIFGSRY
jgi:pyridoxal phosphate enzyme (YggS family)